MKKLIFSLLLLFTIVGFSLADKTIVLSPGWNVISTPKLLSGINFSNGGSGVSFYSLSGGSWNSIVPTIQTIKPLEGFVVNNSTSGDVIMSLLYKTNVNPMETLFQKNLNLGWNLLGITSITNPFTNIGNGAVMSVDFTKNTSNLLNGVNSSFTVNNSSSSIASPELGEAYGLFVTSSGAIYGGNQDINSDTGNIQISGSANVSQVSFSGEETVVLGSTNIDMLKFNIQAGSGGAITVEEIQAKVEYQNDGTGDWLPVTSTWLSQLKLYKGSDLIDSFGSTSLSSGIVTFDGFNVSILENTGQQFTIKINITDNQSIINDKLRVSLLTGIIIEDANSYEIMPTGLPIIGNRILTLTTYGTLTVNTDNTDSATNRDKNILGNTTSDFVASYEFIANNEDIKIEDMTMTASGTNFVDAVSEVILFGNDKTTEIGRKTVTSNTVDFEDVNYTTTKGTTNIYVKVVARKIGQNEAGMQTSINGLTLTIDKAEGDESGYIIINLTGGNSDEIFSKKFDILPVKVSSVTFVSNYGGSSVSTHLLNGENTLAIISITTDSNSNTNTIGGSLKTLLKQIKVKESKYSGTIISNYTLENIDGSDGEITGSISGNYITFDLSNFSSDKLIDNGTTDYYIIKANIIRDVINENDDYVRLSIENLNNGDVVYSANDINIPGYFEITDLRLGFNSLNGVEIWE